LRTGLCSDLSEVRVTVRGQTIETFRTSELDGWQGNLRIVRWPDAVTVPGIFRATDERGEVSFGFEPEGALADGWYAVQVDLTALPTRRTFYT
jgi:hypothetical protein